MDEIFMKCVCPISKKYILWVALHVLNTPTHENKVRHSTKKLVFK